MVSCSQCGKETSNPKFCSRSCTAITNNKNPKRVKKKYFCNVCNKEVSNRKTKCNNCNTNYKDWSNIKYCEITKNRKYQVHSRIRELARQEYKRNNKPNECYVCGYNLHVEICHIKAISSFKKDATIASINNISNLIALYPNHHWELDNNVFSLYPRCITSD